jgi:hypothetical protein
LLNIIVHVRDGDMEYLDMLVQVQVLSGLLLTTDLAVIHNRSGCLTAKARPTGRKRMDDMCLIEFYSMKMDLIFS